MLGALEVLVGDEEVPGTVEVGVVVEVLEEEEYDPEGITICGVRPGSAGLLVQYKYPTTAKPTKMPKAAAATIK